MSNQPTFYIFFRNVVMLIVILYIRRKISRLRASTCAEAFLTMLLPALRFPAIVQIDIASAAGWLRELQAGAAAAALVPGVSRLQAICTGTRRVRRQPRVRPDTGTFAGRLHRWRDQGGRYRRRYGQVVSRWIGRIRLRSTVRMFLLPRLLRLLLLLLIMIRFRVLLIQIKIKK